MNRFQFMRQLEMLLSDVTPSERSEALQFYNDYFDDAGAENEQEVIKALGSPARVAATIKADLSGNGTGEFTENGYRDFENRGQEVAAYGENQSKQSENPYGSRANGENPYGNGTGGGNPYGSAAGENPYSGSNPYEKAEKRTMSGGTIALIVIICIFAAPILLPVAITIMALLVAAIAVLIALVIAAAALAFAFIITGVVLFAAGIMKIVVSPFGGICIAGTGLVCAGLGVIVSLITIWIFAAVIPAVFRLAVNICRKPFARRRGENV